jgi:hypothetical protein
MEATVKKYVDSLTKNLNDAYVSQNVQRRTESKNTPSPGDSMAQATATAATTLEFTNKAVGWWTQFLSGQNLLKSQTLAFRRRVKATYGGLPFCDETPATKAPEDVAHDQAVVKQEAVTTVAVQKQQEALKKEGIPVTETPKAEPWTEKLSPLVPATFSTDMRKIGYELGKDPEAITESDLIAGYQKWKFDEIDSTNELNKQSEEYRASIDGRADKANIYNKGMMAKRYQRALVEYRIDHGNLVPIPESWWAKPSGPPVA